MKKSVKKFPLLSALIGAAVVVLGAVWWLSADTRQDIKRDKYQIVTLSNGQVYIGHLSNLGGRYAVMKDVYYQQQTQAADTPASAQSSNDVVVVKLAASVAKPEDELRISVAEIIHWANLADDSKVVKAIEQDTPAR